jgi:hypothetical protein
VEEEKFRKIAAMVNLIKEPASAATDRIFTITNHLKDSLNPADDLHKATHEAKMSASYKFQGWMGLDKDATKGKMVWQEFEPKTVSIPSLCLESFRFLNFAVLGFPSCVSSSSVLNLHTKTHTNLL